MRENTAQKGVQAYAILQAGLIYTIYGLKGKFDVYILAGANDKTFKCVTEFGEEIIVKAEEGVWIDLETGVQTNTSLALGIAIENNVRYGKYYMA